MKKKKIDELATLFVREKELFNELNKISENKRRIARELKGVK